MAEITTYLVGSILIALLVGALSKPKLIGWLLMAAGVAFLIHAGVTIAIIWANNNVVPPYVSYWGLFATIPTGLLLVILGVATVCIRACVLRLKARRLE